MSRPIRPSSSRAVPPPLDAAAGGPDEPSVAPHQATNAATDLVGDLESLAGAARDPAGATRLLVLLAGDSLPLLGVLLFHWQVFSIILLFWSENVVAGVFTVLKMRRATGTGTVTGMWRGVRLNGVSPVDIQDDRRALIRLFESNYFGFTAVHGIFVVVLFGGVFVPRDAAAGPSVPVAAGWFGVAVVSLVLTYLRDYRREFLAGGEYATVSPIQVMAAPYGRMIVMHLTIIAAGWFVDALGAPLAGLLLLVLLKAGFDAAGWQHARRTARRAAEERGPKQEDPAET